MVVFDSIYVRFSCLYSRNVMLLSLESRDGSILGGNNIWKYTKAWNVEYIASSHGNSKALLVTKPFYALQAKQVHDKFPLCFNSNLNSCRDLHSCNFIGRLFHKRLALKFTEFVSYFWVFAFGIKKEIPLLCEFGIFFSLYVFHIKVGLSSFLGWYISMTRISKFLLWIFSLLSKAKSSSHVAM